MVRTAPGAVTSKMVKAVSFSGIEGIMGIYRVYSE